MDRITSTFFKAAAPFASLVSLRVHGSVGLDRTPLVESPVDVAGGAALLRCLVLVVLLIQDGTDWFHPSCR